MSDFDEETRALVDAARAAYEPAPGAKARVRGAVAAKVAVGAAGAAAGAAITKTAAAGSSVGAGSSVAAATIGTGTKVLLAVGLASGVALGAVQYANVTQSPPPVVPSASATITWNLGQPPKASEAPSRAPQVEAPAPPAPSASASAEPPRAPSTISARAPASRDVPPPSAPAPPSTAIADEVQLIRAAHEALHRGDARKALDALDAHATRFSGGALAEERDEQRVFALCAMGRAAEARAAAERFASSYPGSPHVARLRATCAYEP